MQIGKEMAIPSILKIGNGALGKIGGYLKTEGLDQVVLFFGNGLIDMFGELVMNSLKEADVNVLEYNELDTVDIDDIITMAFAIPNKAKAVISIGGGKVIDAGKYAAFLRNLPFISVPTSSSSDGFSSASASLLVQGKRTSVPARLAYGIIVDTQVIRTAPEKFIYSGIGDMISKITALYDWIFEEKAGCGEVNDFAVMIAKKAVNSFVRTPYESIKDELFLKELLDSLAMSGIANEIAQAPAESSHDRNPHRSQQQVDQQAERAAPRAQQRTGKIDGKQRQIDGNDRQRNGDLAANGDQRGKNGAHGQCFGGKAGSGAGLGLGGHGGYLRGYDFYNKVRIARRELIVN